MTDRQGLSERCWFVSCAMMLAACTPEAASPPEPANADEAASANLATAPTSRPAQQSPLARADEDPALAVEGDGLRLFLPDTGAARPLPFGTSRAAVMAALAWRGPPGTGRQEECGAGPLDYAAWPDGLKLYFQKGKLTGWALEGRASGGLGTAAGVGPGSTRAELEAAHVIQVMQSSLGTEFLSGAIAGVLDGPGKSARITDMWAGASCVMR